MATWDSPYCLALFKEDAGLEDANEYSDSTQLYPLLSRAQQEVIELIAQRYPKAVYQAPAAMTRASDGKTYSFGTDAQGNDIMPLGKVQIATTLSAFAGDRLFNGWREDRDFIDEGTYIRIPSNRSYAGTLYARYVPTPPDMTAVVNPILRPAAHRRLIVNVAVRRFGAKGNQRPDLVKAMKDEWAEMFPSVMLTYKKRYPNGGGLIDPAKWYLSAPDLGSSGS